MINLDKERHLKLGLAGMLAWEKQTGLSFSKGFKLEDLELKEKAAMLWACLIHEDKKLTYEAVVDMVGSNDLIPVMNALVQCLRQAFGEQKADSRPLVKKPQAG